MTDMQGAPHAVALLTQYVRREVARLDAMPVEVCRCTCAVVAEEGKGSWIVSQLEACEGVRAGPLPGPHAVEPAVRDAGCVDVLHGTRPCTGTAIEEERCITSRACPARLLVRLPYGLSRVGNSMRVGEHAQRTILSTPIFPF